MKRWLGLFAVLAVATVVAFVVSVRFRPLTSEDPYRVFSERCDQVHLGMAREDVDALFGIAQSSEKTPDILCIYPAISENNRMSLEVTIRGGVVVKKKLRDY